MFLGGIGDFLFPDLIGKVVNAMREHDQEAINSSLLTWVVIIIVGSLATMLNSILFGLTAERIGNRLRQRLFDSLIHKDTAFFDEHRIGDLCKYLDYLLRFANRDSFFVVSRLTSDTQVV